MGASSSKGDVKGEASEERREEESLAASTGALSTLQSVFSKHSLPETHAIPSNLLVEVFSLNPAKLESQSFVISDYFPRLLANLGPTIVELFFKLDDENVSWVGFLRGYNRCSGRMTVSASLSVLYQLYTAASRKADNPTELEFHSDGKITGYLLLNDVVMLLWMCWTIQRTSRIFKSLEEKSTVVLPDIYPLITSAFLSCNEVGDDLSIENPETFVLETKIPAQKLHTWILTTIPGLASCISQYVQIKLQAAIASGGNVEPSSSSSSEDPVADAHNTYLLTCGRAWAISLSLRSSKDELLEACFSRSSGTLDNLLYRSSVNGKGLSRFWSNVEGYQGPLLILVRANSIDSDSRKDENGSKQWVFSILTGQGIENQGTFYGSSGYLFAVNPIFRVFPASGKDKNFVYCHLHPTGRSYDPNPKPVGLAFGGTIGKERIFIDEDFSEVTIRHHAVDKTYQRGSLISNQGFLPTSSSVLDVEVWGLGGETAKQKQDTHKKRETLFSEQRRKVDLKKFGNWEDSPEKMMMDMVSNPNRPRREER